MRKISKTKTHQHNTVKQVAARKQNTGVSCQPREEQTKSHLFNFQSHNVRVVMDGEGNPWFVAKDVCDVLEVENSRKACTNLKEKHKGVSTVDTLGGSQHVTIVNESGLYSLIFKSRKPSAEAFKDWVTEDVLPSIRKTGGYTVPKHMYNNVADLLGQTVHALEGLQAENKALYPKARCFDLYQNSESKHGLQAAAKILGLKPNTFIKELLAEP